MATPLNNNVFSYYRPSHGDLSQRSLIMRALDSRVGEIALKVISSSTLTIGVALACLSVAVIGVSVPSIIATVVFFKIGIVALYALGNLKKYHKADTLSGYRQEAVSQMKALVFLDETNFFKDKESKKEVLRPLSYIATSHFGLGAIFQRQLLSPKDFKTAFDLEIKYKDFFESIEFYNKLLSIYEKEKKANPNLPTYSFFEKEALRQKFQEHFAPLSKEGSWKYEEVAKAYKGIEKIAEHLLLLKKLEVIPEGKLEILNELNTVKNEMKEAFEELPRLDVQEKALFAVDYNSKISLRSHKSFKELEKEQEGFLKRVEKCQAEEEKEVDQIEKEYQIEKVAFSKNPEMQPSIDSSKNKKIQKIREKFEKKLKEESENSTLALKAIIERCVLHQENHKNTSQETLLKKLSESKEVFALDHAAKIQEFKDKLHGKFVALLTPPALNIEPEVPPAKEPHIETEVPPAKEPPVINIEEDQPQGQQETTEATPKKGKGRKKKPAAPQEPAPTQTAPRRSPRNKQKA